MNSPVDLARHINRGIRRILLIIIAIWLALFTLDSYLEYYLTALDEHYLQLLQLIPWLLPIPLLILLLRQISSAMIGEISQELAHFIAIFTQAEQQERQIDTRQLKFDQFVQLGTIVNKMLEQQRAATNQLSEAQAMANLGSWELWFENERLVWSSQVYAIFELPKEQPPSYTQLLSVVHPEDRELLDTTYRQSLQEQRTYSLEHRLLMTDGRVKYVLEHGQHHYDANGKPIRSVGSVQDITATKRLAHSLQQERERLELVLAGTDAGLWDWNMSDNRVVFNQRWAEIIGYTLEELQPLSLQTWLDNTHPDDLHHSSELIEKHIQGESELYACEVRMRHRDGHWVWVQDRGKVVEWSPEGRPLRMTGTHVEITDQKEGQLAIEQARQEAIAANSAKSAFLANMSHEIRTPMNGVIGMVDLLLQTPLNKQQQRYAQTIATSGKALLQLINDILDFSKIEAGKMELNTIDFNIHHLLDDLHQLLQQSARQKGLNLIISIDPAIPEWLHGDPGRLRQILLNLAGNAIKFTQQGYVTIKLSQQRQLLAAPKERVELKISVKDSGIGIAADKLPLLFQNFQQLDSSSTRQHGGTGLGLAISKRLTELMQGKMGVSSEEGRGSSFDVYLTLLTAKEPLPQAEPATEPHRRLLLVHHPLQGALQWQQQLQAHGWQVEPLQYGLDLLQRLREEPHPFDAAIIDSRIIDIDAATLGRVIRDTPELELPLVLFDADPHRGQALSSQQAGFAAYLSHPVTPAELQQALERLSRSPTPIYPLITRHQLKEQHAALLLEAAESASPPILIVEDNPTNQIVIQAILERLGYTDNDLAEDGLQALEKLRQQRYALILMDIQMPNMDGLETTRTIRDPASTLPDHDIPIIAVTANAMKGDRERCLQQGMNDYISKPVDAKLLAQKLHQWLPKQPAPCPASETESPATCHASDHENNHAIFDFESAYERLMNNQGLFLRVADAFIEDGPKQLQTIAAAVASRELSAIQKSAHKLKGSTSNLSALALSHTAKAMENAARLEQLDEAISYWPQLQSEFTQFMQQLQQRRDEMA
ncbi:response regulator [Ectothiorhodospiraceae bacterium BW-2]|nr:response regulator [Ectothiorhodospiraceae bacterium BW-2]